MSKTSWSQKGWDNKPTKLQFQSILRGKCWLLSTRHESTEVDRRTWLHVPSGTHWSTSSDINCVDILYHFFWLYPSSRWIFLNFKLLVGVTFGGPCVTLVTYSQVLGSAFVISNHYVQLFVCLSVYLFDRYATLTMAETFLPREMLFSRFS